jgi:hypothetical protein
VQVNQVQIHTVNYINSIRKKIFGKLNIVKLNFKKMLVNKVLKVHKGLKESREYKESVVFD